MNKEDWILIIFVFCALLGVIGGFKIANWAIDRDLAVAIMAYRIFYRLACIMNRG
jgi:uncharacterized protein YneF (UPF0154 family)